MQICFFNHIDQFHFSQLLFPCLDFILVSYSGMLMNSKFHTSSDFGEPNTELAALKGLLRWWKCSAMRDSRRVPLDMSSSFSENNTFVSPYKRLLSKTQNKVRFNTKFLLKLAEFQLAKWQSCLLT